MVTGVDVETNDEVTRKVAVLALTFTVTVAGTLAALVLLLDRETVMAEGVGPVRVTVPVEFAIPPKRVEGERLSDCTVGGKIESEAGSATPL